MDVIVDGRMTKVMNLTGLKRTYVLRTTMSYHMGIRNSLVLSYYTALCAAKSDVVVFATLLFSDPVIYLYQPNLRRYN